MKEFYICRLSGDETIDFDSLPVAKITHYPHEKHDYKPYAQVCIGFNQQEIGIRLISFEKIIVGYSSIVGILELFKNKTLEIEVTPEKGTAKIISGDDIIETDIEQNTVVGEDLQGVYWGKTIFINLELLSNYGELNLENDEIDGNFFKVNENKDGTLHIGDLGSAELLGNVEYSKEKTLGFKIISY